MIAAVRPTNASSRSGTPALRSDKARKPPARLVTSLDTCRPYCTNLRGRAAGSGSKSSSQTRRVQPQHLADALSSYRTWSQDPWRGSGQVDDRRCGLLRGRTRVEVNLDEIAELAAGL